MKKILLLWLVTFFGAASQGTVSSTTSRVTYTGTDAVSTYSYTFKIFSADDLDVIVRKTSDGTETTLTRTTHYTVTGVGNSAGGNVVLVNGSFVWLDADGDLDDGYKITIRRKMDLTQATAIANQGTYYPRLHENALDKLTYITQQHQDELDRCVQVPWGDTVVSLTLPNATDRASKFLAFSSTGAVIASSGGISDSLPVSSFIETLLDDTTATAARTTLGATAGVWLPSQGGTGVANNDAATLTRSGNHALTLTTTATTGVTLPTTGTLASLAGTESLSNKTFSDSPRLAEIAAPSTPASGFFYVYPKTDGLLYTKNDGGIEMEVGGTVLAAATGDAASASSGNPIIVPTETVDTHSAYNNTTGRFTCPVTGYYEVSISGNVGAGTAQSVYLYKGAVSSSLITSISTTDIGLGGSVVTQCTAAEILDVRPNNTIDFVQASIIFKRL